MNDYKMLISSINIQIKGIICNKSTVLYLRMTLLCHQRLRKHAKMKYWQLGSDSDVGAGLILIMVQCL